MLSFLRRSQATLPNLKLARALEADGLPPSVNSAQLAVVSEKGQYAGRGVTFFRVFEPRQTTALGLNIRAYGQLDGSPELIFRAGHIERNGDVVLSTHAELTPPVSSVRSEADVAAHDGDQEFIFGKPHQ